ncbi:MAG: hypothetical protein JKX83_06580 [Pseudomonadales bacterium]|nr:hypothetical protein [Pseudomonadales bacterium]
MNDARNSAENIPLDLANAPVTLFLFGLSGSGKSYVGNLIAELDSWHVYHADDDLTDEMKLALKEKRPFTETMRDNYFPVVVERILELKNKHQRLVVTQGVYKQRHRDILVSSIPMLEMLCVDASNQCIGERLGDREGGITAQSAAALRKDFELPDSNTKIIVNQGGRQEIIQQLNRFYSKPLDVRG